MSDALPAVRAPARTPAVSGGALVGEVLGALDDAIEEFVACVAPASAQTARTYRMACRRLAAWLGPGAAFEQITAVALSAYDAHLANGRSPATVRKERAAINSLLRWATQHGLIDRPAAERALGVKLPKVSDPDREQPMTLSDDLYRRLIMAAEAKLAHDPVLGARDVAILRVLGDVGLRAEELCRLKRRDFLAARRGSDLRRLHVHGKGGRRRRARIPPNAARAIVRWDQQRQASLGPASPDDPLFVTLGRRRRDGTYTRPGQPVAHSTLDELVKRYAQRAGIPAELSHCHVLRHTCASRMLARRANAEEVRQQLGHASLKTTQIYLHVPDQTADRTIAALDDDTLTLEQDATEHA